ncbi:unnamed protein product [Phytophthora fragariaefolia]|uniref:Unnamed protein product n=1 Tax=Phytophthora fragariaefolia TaxID=1490495 RepID=A0A9W6XWI3_9STRA|nr:unnamed protein product [Phytophthora fragariaefolia]
MEFLQASLLLDTCGKRLAATMDRFGFYLATNEGKNGKLTRNNATLNHRNVKLWLFDKYPHLRVPIELILLKQGRTLDKHCLKRENGGMINKAPPCTKDDLRCLIRYVYSTAQLNTDYQDAALACLMWHCFGRSSDLGYIQKQHVSASADGTFYIRLLRDKTSEEQGLTLIPDKIDFLTCLLHALAVAQAMQGSPSPLHDIFAVDAGTLQVSVVASPTVSQRAGSPASVFRAFDGTVIDSQSQGMYTLSVPAQTKSRQRGAKRGEDRVQAYVNRLLKRVSEPAGATADLTSHSFRRGGAQHANGNDRLAAQWIFGRGAWDMSKTNKAFAYITNTAREDRKVARVLSGWGADDKPAIIDIANLDHTTQERLGRFQTLLFRIGLKEQRLNISNKVLSVLTEYPIRYYPSLKELAPTAPIVIRVEECLEAADIPVADILSLSVTLSTAASPPVEGQIPDKPNHICARIDHFLAVIEELIASNKALAARLSIDEAAQLNPKRTQETTPLKQPRYVRSGAQTEAQEKTSYKPVILVVRMLFLVDGFKLDENDDDIKDRVLETGRIAESNVLMYLQDRGIKAKGAGTVLREMRKLLRAGDLDERIITYRHLLAIDRIQDPAPADTQNIFTVADQV